jgi:hypothetical protein
MTEKGSLVESLYPRVKAEILSGVILPGQKLDFMDLCHRFGVSKSPMRNILNRLVGESLLDVQAHDGFYRPWITERKLRDLYRWIEDILLLSLQGPALAPFSLSMEGTPEADWIDATERLFEALAGLGGNEAYRRAMIATNDQLRSIRNLKSAIAYDWKADPDAILSAWQNNNLPALRAAIRGYVHNRLERVPQILATVYSVRFERLPEQSENS